MALNLVNLDYETRRFMVEEIDSDINSNRLYPSPRLSALGNEVYPSFLRQAAESHDDSWLARQLSGKFNATEIRSRKGKPYTASVPENAGEVLAEGEFNRFYLRGLCRRAIHEGIPALKIYRAKMVNTPRPESEAKIGTEVDPVALLNDLRAHPGADTASGLPSGPNSGLSARLP